MLLVVGGSVSVTTCQKDLQQVCQQLVTMLLFHHAAGTKLSLTTFQQDLLYQHVCGKLVNNL